MRCLACNKNLNDFESTRKHPETGEYIDLCNHCYHDVQDEIYADEREDLREGDDELFDEENKIEIDFDKDLFLDD